MDNQNKTKFNQWVQLAECKTLKPNQRIILISILNLHNIEGWDFTPLSVLNERSGISVSTIQRSIKGLVKMGLIEKVLNRNRKKYGKDPNDYIPNYTNILNLLNSQIGQNDHNKNNSYSQNDHNKNNSYSQNDHNSYSQNDHNVMVKMTNKNNRKKEKEKNNSLYNSTYNDSTRRYMVYPDNENENNQITNTDMKNQITDNTENGNPINGLLDFDFSDCDENPNSLEVPAAERDKTENAADRSAAINPKDAETAYEYAMIGYNTNPKTALNSPKAAGATEIAHSEVLSMQVDSYSTHAEKTPQEGNIEGNGTDNDNTKTTETNTDSPNSEEHGFNEAVLDFGDSPTTTEETAAESDKSQDTETTPTATNIQEAQINDRGEVLMSSVDSYSIETKKTPQGRNKEGYLEMDTAAEDTQIPNNGENTAPTTNTLSKEEAQRIMTQAAQTIMKNRKHVAADTQNAPKNDRGEEITPLTDNYTTAAEKTPQGAKNSGMAADTAAATVWGIRNTADICWQETFELAAADFVNPTESKIRTLLNKVYKDWRNTDPKNNKKMITEMKNYISYKYHINLDTEVEKRNNDNNSDAYPTAEEIEKLSVCHISKNMDILNRLSAGCKHVNTVILALNKAIEFTQIYRIATPQQYNCITNAMSILDKCPTVSDKKSKYITDLATHLCDMLEKVC